MTITQMLIALAVVLPIGLLGGWLRRFLVRRYRIDLVGWLALASAMSFVAAVVVFYWPSTSYLHVNSAIVLVLLSSGLGFLGLGGWTFGRHESPLLTGVQFCLLAMPLIALTAIALFVLLWVGAHLPVKEVAVEVSG